MTNAPSNKHGIPNWAACATTDLQGAETFYRAVFGWESEHFTSSGGEACSIQHLGGRQVASLYEMNPELLGRNVPPHWETYIEVDDVDDVLEKVRQADGEVVAGPFVEPGVGTMAVIQDNVGALFMVAHSVPKKGGQAFNRPGAITWNELCTKEPAKAAEFYSKVFDLEPVEMEGPNPYTLLKKNDRGVAGILCITDEMGEVLASWDVYFASDDVDATVTAVKEAGGSALREPFDLPGVGARMAVLQDPQGAVFEVIKDLA